MKVLIATEKPFAKSAVEGIESILKEAGYEVVRLEKYADKSELLAAVADVDALIIRSDKVTAEVLDAAKQLKIVVRAGAGFDNVDCAAAKDKGVVVMNTPGQNSNAVAELALGMNVVAYDPFITDDAVFERDGVKKMNSIAELYAAADYLSLHIPATAETKGSIGYDLAMSMPKGATIVNTARKEVINEEGLMKAMEEREDLKYITDIAPDAKDVYAEKFGKRYFGTPKKQGAETAEANVNAGLAAARQIVDYFVNGNVRFQVNK